MRFRGAVAALLIGASFVGSAPFVGAAPPVGGAAIAEARRNTAPELTLRATRDWSPDPLTSDRMAVLDPLVPNPHRQRWALGRELSLDAIEPFQRDEKSFGIAAATIVSKARIQIRPPGPWYRPIYEYPCPTKKSPAAGDLFATESGVRAGAEGAAKLWDSLLDARKTRLQMILGQISASTRDIAIARAKFFFEVWRAETESEWHRQAPELTRRLAARVDAEAAQGAGLCSAKGAPAAEPLSWSAVMEAPAAENRAHLLVRAPARRWNGMFTVRLDVVIGARRLNGQFLIDSGARHSLVSPSWLEGQGMPAEYIGRNDRPLQRMAWSRGATGLLRTATVDRVDMSGHPLDLNEFLIAETNELFTPPDFQASCCDGVLGADFFARHIVELVPGIPPAVRLWSKEGYRFPEASSAWVETAVAPNGDLESVGCAIEADHPRRARASSSSKVARVAVPGVKWDTGDEFFLDVHSPWQKLAAANGKLWSLRCDTQDLTDHIPITLPHVSGALEQSLFASKNPGVTAGMSLLARGSVAFDLPHGRLWLSSESLKAPLHPDRSGLGVEFIEDKAGERQLRVTALKPGSAAESLRKAGLRPGVLLSQINAKPANEMDLWEVHRHLAGDYGTSLNIQWKGGGGERKTAPLHLEVSPKP